MLGSGKPIKKTREQANEAHNSETEEEDAMDVDEELDDEEEVATATVARTAAGKAKGPRGRNERVMPPEEVRSHLRILFVKERELCHLLYARIRPTSVITSAADMFFMDVVPVAPTRFRPASKLGDDLFENQQNSLLTSVLQTCVRIKDLNHNLIMQGKVERGEMVLDAVTKVESGRTFELLLEALVKLQTDVNAFMDSTKNVAPMRQGKLPPQGVKQLLEKKEGLFRKHMMVCIRSCGSTDLRVNE